MGHHVIDNHDPLTCPHPGCGVDQVPAGTSPDANSTDLDHSNTVRAGVFGIQDGVVSNFGLIMGVAGAQVSPAAVLIAGIAGLVSGAMSMGAGEYVSVRTQRELLQAGRAVEEDENVNPYRAAAANGLLFAIGGLVPLLPFLLSADMTAVVLSIVLSVTALFGAGAVLTRLTRQSVLRSGVRMLVIGGGAGLLGYVVGSVVGSTIGV